MTTRPQDLTFTRELLIAMLAPRGGVLLSAVMVSEALAIDDSTLREIGDAGEIDFVRKGKRGRVYTIEAVLDFIAKGGRSCRPIGAKAGPPTPTISASKVVDFTAQLAAQRDAERKNSSAT